MSYINLAIGSLAFAGALQVAISSITPTAKFMTVHSVDMIGDQVQTIRSVHVRGPGEVVADWSVVVVGEDMDAPSCATIHGPSLHEGWSRYKDKSRSPSTMSLDVWVNDPGCYERLRTGDYKMHHTWTPRDGSPPVVFVSSIRVEK